ncbi:non-ribosomal peptide synthetase [Streptomyces minutiscleroticus]|uniref:non-ribosomal peptide synthetase n=1 Tax=Streptomyces minutiscleroticus TaxID=68238 RepID=UPI00332B61F7
MTVPTLLERFAGQVAARPESVALRHAGTSLAYGELDGWSGRLAAQLVAKGVGPDSLVALAARRGPAAIAGVLAVLKTGAAYLGLDPATPVRRQRRMVEETGPDCLLAEPGLDQFPTLDAARVTLAPASSGPLHQAPGRVPGEDGDGDALFHIVYTSGTTGNPKGVRIGTRSVRGRLEWMWRDHPFPPDAVLAVQKSPALVASPWEMLGGLLMGVPSVVLTDDEVLDPELFAAVVAKERITHLFLTPHLLDGLLSQSAKFADEHQPVLVTTGADTLPVAMARRFHAVWPRATLLNLYGMTETASNVAAYDTSSLPADAERVPVGTPVAGALLSVRDRHGRRLPPGVTGEVWVAGPPVALGYVGGDDEDAFRTDDRGVRHYRTGDRGRLLPDGALELTGRTDHQVKIRGYRVELEEIESVLRKAPDVTDAGAYVDTDGDEPRLVACVVYDDQPGGDTLRAYLRDRLPDYMLPARIQKVARLPLGANGKLDRAALRTLVTETGQERAVRFAPADADEAAVAALWEELLGTAPGTADENFFDAGGHSLLAVRLANRLSATAGRRIPLRRILAAPTVTGVATLLRTARQGEEA